MPGTSYFCVKLWRDIRKNPTPFLVFKSNYSDTYLCTPISLWFVTVCALLICQLMQLLKTLHLDYFSSIIDSLTYAKTTFRYFISSVIKSWWQCRRLTCGRAQDDVKALQLQLPRLYSRHYKRIIIFEANSGPSILC